MPKTQEKTTWSESFGDYGNTIRVAEREPGGTIYVFWTDQQGVQHKRSLRTRDKKRARELAKQWAKRLSAYAPPLHPLDRAERDRLTLGELADLYVLHGLHGRTEKYKAETESRLRFVVSYFGAKRHVDTLSPSDVERFAHARKTGEVRPEGSRRTGSVGAATVRHDLVALNTALNWAVRHRDHAGRRLLTANPLKGVRLPTEPTPKRPRAGTGYYRALRSIAHRSNPKFKLALDLAAFTGHRIGAILRLRWEDISFEATEHAPYGSIRWRREYDKKGKERVVPMNKPAHDALRAALRERPAIGAAWVFPSDTDPSVPVDRHLASRWLRRAEKLAGIKHEPGRGWHAFRRKWASDRKHLPDVDVMYGGGWSDLETMKRSYQQPDDATVYRVVSEPVADLVLDTGT